ncbi:MAG: pectin acetylesterase-family hydrolase [Polyangiaceae bacterium]
MYRRTFASVPAAVLLPCAALTVLSLGCGSGEATSGSGFTALGGGGGSGTSATGGDSGTTSTTGTNTTGTTSTSGSGGQTTSSTGPYCGDGHVDPGEACDDGNDNQFDGCLPDCTVVPPIDAPTLKWKYIEVPGTVCMNGDTAGFGISINPASPNVMIYLEGGGACFNDACDFSAFSIPFVPPIDGIFNRDNPGNPVKDWSMIYVPYCSGDIHGGDKDTMLGGKMRYFHGYRNITKYLQQWVPTFANADNVLLTGISAGGFGAGLNAAHVADAFGPGHQMITIDDSGPPLSQDVISPCLQQIFRDVWGLDQTLLAGCGADCSDPNNFSTGMLNHVLSSYPEMRFGLFSNTADLVIRTFMGFGWCDGTHDDCDGTATNVPAQVYEDGLLALRAAHENRAATYYVGQDHFGYNFGLNHTVLRSPSFWTTTIDGVQVSEWVGKVINGTIQHVGP